MKKKTFNYLAAVICITAFSIGLGMYTSQYYAVQRVPEIEGFMWPEPKQIVQFLTIDQDGNEFGLEQLMGKWSMVFFGYTHCPDVCPITLSVFKQAVESTDEEDVQAIFVSVDEERDTIERIKEYVGYFHPEMIGLGGTPEQINTLTSQLGVVSMRGADTSDGGYLVDHSAAAFLIGPQGRLLSVFTAPHDKETIITRLQAIRNFIP